MSEEKPTSYEESDGRENSENLLKYCPGITAEESKERIDNETFIIMDRRVRVARMYAAGKSFREIAAELKCGFGTVHKDIHEVVEYFRRASTASVADRVALQLLRLQARESDIEEQWEKSKGEYIESSATQRGNGSTTSVKKKTRCGDPRFAKLLLECWELRCKLLGILEIKDIREAVSLPAKLVAGFDPVELV